VGTVGVVVIRANRLAFPLRLALLGAMPALHLAQGCTAEMPGYRARQVTGVGWRASLRRRGIAVGHDLPSLVILRLPRNGGGLNRTIAVMMSSSFAWHEPRVAACALSDGSHRPRQHPFVFGRAAVGSRSLQDPCLRLLRGDG